MDSVDYGLEGKWCPTSTHPAPFEDGSSSLAPLILIRMSKSYFLAERLGLS